MTYKSLLKAAMFGLAVTVGTAAVSAPSAKAATVFFTDRDAWEDAVPEFTLEDFSTPTLNADSFAFDDVNVTSTGTPTSAGSRNRVSDGRRFSGLLNNDDSNRYNTITWTFGDSDVIGFFADFFSVEDGLTLTGNYDDGATVDLFAQVGESGGFGLVSDSSFDSITYGFTGTGPVSFRVDDLAVAVPTPALLPGLIGMGVAALRKKNEGEATEEA